MLHPEHVILEKLEEAQVLGVFLKYCERYSTPSDLQKLRNIYFRTNNPVNTTKAIATRDFDADLTLESAQRLHELVMAHLKKTNYRRQIPIIERNQLLKKQDYKCAICNHPIDMHAHADHIVPFKYVGDELDDNLQMLCSECNTKKNASLFFQINYFLGLTYRKEK